MKDTNVKAPHILLIVSYVSMDGVHEPDTIQDGNGDNMDTAEPLSELGVQILGAVAKHDDIVDSVNDSDQDNDHEDLSDIDEDVTFKNLQT